MYEFHQTIHSSKRSKFRSKCTEAFKSMKILMFAVVITQLNAQFQRGIFIVSKTNLSSLKATHIKYLIRRYNGWFYSTKFELTGAPLRPDLFALNIYYNG